MHTPALKIMLPLTVRLLALALLPPALAQTEPPPVLLDPFNVSATPTKGYMATNTISGTAMNMPLREVPMAINVITSEFLEDSLVGNLADAFDYNSSITQTFRPQVGNFRQIFAIRGFLTRNVLLDGVLAGNEVPTYLVDRIEVVKGPNTLYGQSDPGGLINIVMKRPTGRAAADLTQKIGNHGFRETQLDVTTAPIGDRLAVRAIAAYMDTDGWFPVDGQESATGAIMADYNLTSNTKLLLLVSARRTDGIPTSRSAYSFERVGLDLDGDGIISSAFVNGIQENNAAVNSTFLPRNFNGSTRHNYYIEETSYMQAGIRHRFADGIYAQYVFVRSELDMELFFREFNTFNTAGIADGTHNATVDHDMVDAHTLNVHFDFKTGPLRHRVTAGARTTSGFNQQSNMFLSPTAAGDRAVLESLSTGGRNIRLFLSKADVLAGAPIWNDDVPSYVETRTLGRRQSTTNYSTQDITTFYLTDGVTLLEDRLKLLGGVRYVKVEDAAYDLQGVKASNLTNRDDTSVQLGGVYDLPIGVSVYASYATSFIPNRYNAATNEFFPPEESVAYEVGLKFEDLWAGRIGGSLSFFQIDKINVLRTGAHNITRVPFTELSEDRSKGFEAELFLNLTENWSSVLSYSHLDAATVASETVPVGLALEGAPPHRLTFWTSYRIGSGPLKGLRFGGGVVWADGPIQQFNTSPNALVVEDGYTEVDLFARYETKLGDRPVSFGVNIANFTDTTYLRARAMLNDPRQVVFSVKLGL